MAAALLLLLGLPVTAQLASKPNIIPIVSDDFGHGDAGPQAAASDAACPRPASTDLRTKA